MVPCGSEDLWGYFVAQQFLVGRGVGRIRAEHDPAHKFGGSGVEPPIVGAILRSAEGHAAYP